jgi:CHASE3 domain sensor protein
VFKNEIYCRKKIGLGFAIIGFLILVVFGITLNTVKEAKQTLQI